MCWIKPHIAAPVSVCCGVKPPSSCYSGFVHTRSHTTQGAPAFVSSYFFFFFQKTHSKVFHNKKSLHPVWHICRDILLDTVFTWQAADRLWYEVNNKLRLADLVYELTARREDQHKGNQAKWLLWHQSSSGICFLLKEQEILEKRSRSEHSERLCHPNTPIPITSIPQTLKFLNYENYCGRNSNNMTAAVIVFWNNWSA